MSKRCTKKMIERICALRMEDTYTIAEICTTVGISERSYYSWKKENAEFADALKEADDIFDQRIIALAKKSLVKKIEGYTVQEKKMTTINTGKKDEEGKPVVKVKEHSVTEKHYQPDTTAIIFTLTNKDPENWKNRQSTELDVKDLSNISFKIGLKEE